jgi:hypothetical protein
MDAEGNSLTLVLLQGIEKVLRVTKNLLWRLLYKLPVSIDYLRTVLLETERLLVRLIKLPSSVKLANLPQ